MKLLLNSLLLTSLCVRSSCSVSSDTLVVTQTPDVSVMEGETINISCCWTGQFERGRVKWLRNQTDTTETETLLRNNSQGSGPKETSDCSNLTFMNITREDSARYTCIVSVEIPFFNVSEGKGTVITVMAKENMKDNTEGGSHDEEYGTKDVLVHVLRYLPILALVTTFIYLNKLGTKAQQHTPVQRPEEGEEEEEGGEEEEDREKEGEGDERDIEAE